MARCLNCMQEYNEFKDECPYCGFVNGTPAKEPFHLNPGVELEERYILGTVTSYGGFGVVYVAWDTVLKCKVAIKEYFPSGLITREPGTMQVKAVNERRRIEFEQAKERFLLEAKIMTKFDGHPNIVSIMSYFEANGTAYIVMEYLEGVTLKEYIKTNPIDVDTAVDIAIKICDIVEEMHKEKILHRDIAPDNIFICLGGIVKLIDFGAARLSEGNNKLTKILKLGYAPPEQYSTDKEQGNYTDVYALGATLYRVLTGQMPDEASNRVVEDVLEKPNKLNPEISEQISNAILRAMAVIPGLRYQTMGEFKDALLGNNVAVNPNDELKKRKIKRIISISLATLVIGIGALSGYFMMQNKKKAAELPEANVEIWIPVAEDADAEAEMQVMLEEFKENYPHVKVQVKGIKEADYSNVIQEATSNESLPVLYYQQELKEDINIESLYPEIKVFSFVKEKDYYFGDKIKDLSESYHQMPTGIVETVLYTKKGTDELTKEARNQLLEQQISKGFAQSLYDFRNGKADYLIAGTDQYYEIFHNMADYPAIAGKVEVRALDEEKAYGYLSDYWCISNSATANEKQCAVMLLAYFLSGNCQRSFFTVEDERQSTGAPVYKEVFDTNYFDNMVGKKMQFLREDLEKTTLINEFNGVEDYYQKLLSEMKE